MRSNYTIDSDRLKALAEIKFARRGGAFHKKHITLMNPNSARKANNAYLQQAHSWELERVSQIQ
jgi:hypothetical protein